MKQTIKEFSISIIALIAFMSVCAAAAHFAFMAEDRVAAYEKERDDHVIATWSDGREHPDHQCNYGADWCNPVYCKHLLDNSRK